ncbi:MAG TPA: hypothetical protein VF622_01810 [Segetibacter sp.]|jgi:hypothetical protein
MKTLFSKSICFLFVITLLGSCSKDNIVPSPVEPVPTNPAEMGLFRFIADVNLTGEPYHQSNLTAVVSIINGKNEEVVNEKTLSLNLDGTVKSEAIQLPVGNYKLTRFRLVYGGVNTHFATPKAGSAKAAAILKPLDMSFTVTKTSSDVRVEAIRVQAGERPTAFGYPVGSFDNDQEENSPYFKIKIKAIMQIGDVLYDSIPAALALTTWDKNGEMTTTYTALKAGVNEISLLKVASKFQFRVDKWGTWDVMTLDRKDVDEGTVYTLGGSKAAKKLKSEMTYKLVDGQYLPDTKTDYVYDGSGRLSQVLYFLRKSNNTPYLAMADEFEYSGGKVEKINRFDKESNSLIGFTSFRYDNQGKVTSISHKENGVETNASVEYSYNPKQEIIVRYQYPGRSITMTNVMQFVGGNMVESAATTSNNNSELGRYSYDFNINPYIHMKWPNLFLSNTSKNNKLSQYKTYYGSYPTAEPYSYNYNYDIDGYPKELIKHFKSYTTNSFLFTTKTVYVY